jgi:hypothetical protein
MMQTSSTPDLHKVTRITAELLASDRGIDFANYLREAKEYLLYYDWCKEILEARVRHQPL